MNQSNLPAIIESTAKAQGLTLSAVNLIMPTETFGAVLGEFDKVTIETVSVDVSDSRNVYEPSGQGKGFAFGKPVLQAIASALSIQWHPQLTGIIESGARKSRAKAVGIMRKPNGEIITQTEEKTIDLDVEEDDCHDKAVSKAEKGNPDKIIEWKQTKAGKSYPVLGPWLSESERLAWIEVEIKKSIKQKRRFKDELAMTGAKDRVIRAFLALKSTYTAEELSKPLAFPRVVTDTSKMLADPRTRSAAISMIGQVTADLYGKAPASIEAPRIAGIQEEEADPAADAKVVTPLDDADIPLTMPGAEHADNSDAQTEATAEALLQWMEADIPSNVKAALQSLVDRGENRKEILSKSLELVKFLDVTRAKNIMTAIAAMIADPKATAANFEALRVSIEQAVVLKGGQK